LGILESSVCEEWAKLAKDYSRALNAHKAAVIGLPGRKDREYEVACGKLKSLERRATPPCRNSRNTSNGTVASTMAHFRYSQKLSGDFC
jgi:hypothetical protein